MAELLANIKGKAIVSLNDHPDVRQMWFHIERTEIRYTLGGAKNYVDRGEVLILTGM